MLRNYFVEKYEIVIAERQGRNESFYRSFTSRIFYKLIQKLTFPEMPKKGFDFVLLGRRALAILRESREAYPFFQGQILSMGFKTKTLSYYREKRSTGKSRWTFWRKITYFIDGVTAYSFSPIRITSLIGVLLALAGFLYAAFIFIAKIFWDNPVRGWAPIMIIILIIGGVQMIMLGILGEYMWRTLAQVRNRPVYIVEEIYE